MRGENFEGVPTLCFGYTRSRPQCQARLISAVTFSSFIQAIYRCDWSFRALVRNLIPNYFPGENYRISRYHKKMKAVSADPEVILANIALVDSSFAVVSKTNLSKWQFHVKFFLLAFPSLLLNCIISLR